MKKIFFVGKVLSITTFGFLGMLSLIMFPFLIGDKEVGTSIIGFSYLGLLLVSITIIYQIIKKEIK